jgi:hypothetical protein
MKTIRITRANFPENGMFSWMNYFKWILEKKYNVIIDSKTPDIVFWTNFHNEGKNIDHYTKDLNHTIDKFPNAKKIFITGEYFNHSAYSNVLASGEDHYALGFCDAMEHESRYLRFPTYVLDTWVLYDESRIFDEPFSWLTKPKDPEKMFNKFKRFCSIVQASDNPVRGKLFDLLIKYKPIKSSGPWRPTVEPNELPEKYLYLQPEYIGRVDGLTYRSKIEFFKDCKFNIAFQFTDTPCLTQEKIVHAFAAGTIPIFHGNNRISEDFNPESFINAHSFNSFEELTEYVIKVDQDDNLCKKILAAPYCHNNTLPEYYSSERLLSFFEKVINAI